ncbi:hypothetical protein RHMOL_Rhmol05G0118400 [Rhododendron molle]|uniref:Uncharacterized protein n=1 Tax=Rhododendron molle TaxID=49168 RepID=A0ACC0NNA9_RHOML|nr:hypothetical protein RHMOL_Rhmol05G0118400 [Rhododendron molle]
MRPLTLGSSQAEIEPEEIEPKTELSIPVTGQVEYNSEGDEVVDTTNLRSPQWQNFQKIKLQWGVRHNIKQGVYIIIKSYLRNLRVEQHI